MSISRREFAKSALAAALWSCGVGVSLPALAADGRAIVYNAPAEWAGWGAMLQLIKKETGISVPVDNKNSGQSVSQILAEQKNPVADACYLGVSFAINAKNQGLVENYKGEGWNRVPDGLKDPDGAWVSIHAGTIGLMVNVEALDGLPVPKSWNDLLDPKYEGLVGFLDPSSAFVGYACAMAVNQAMGGSLDNFQPALDYFKKLRDNSPIVPKQTAYARCLSGEIPILFDYDFAAYRAKHVDGAPIEFVIPAEGTIQVPYVMCLVKNAPHMENGKAVIDFVLSEKGQKHWADNFLRPVVGELEKIAPEAAAKFLPASEYARAGSIDYGRMAEVQQAFGEAYLLAMKS
ncbi:MAG: extracellular solute-binding protein [Sutterella parvirubra]|uniref:ABC transporter, solute-binding protein n=1 Tax=Sutterella parvirubra YIT 11816 TaxID=762967 RepID=H3KBY1_9BURK|nr:extracellular solute-binding protein [Sutterella parvirubra]EHY32389.1 ABC transporter, solute-binding protein [Sutterella parvirubra YIT 11816]MDY5200896.1 extracellular solute-binding protein [Sutterella parvirubra]